MYRLYGPGVPRLGEDDWGVDWSGLLNTGVSTAVQYAQAQQQADAAAAAAEAQQEAIAAQTNLVKQQTLLQQATAAAKSVVSTAAKNPLATGTIVAVAIGAVALFFIMRKKK